MMMANVLCDLGPIAMMVVAVYLLLRWSRAVFPEYFEIEAI